MDLDAAMKVLLEGVGDDYRTPNPLSPTSSGNIRKLRYQRIMDFDAEAKAFVDNYNKTHKDRLVRVVRAGLESGNGNFRKLGKIDLDAEGFVGHYKMGIIDFDTEGFVGHYKMGIIDFDAEAKASVDDYYNTRDRLVGAVRAGLESNFDAEMKAFVDDYNNTHKDRLSSYGSMPASKGQKIQGIMDRDRKVRAFVIVVRAGPESLSSYGSMPASEGQKIQGNFRKLGIMDRDRKVRAFVEHYYNIFDTCRAGLVVLYQDGAMLTLEGSKFQGVQAIVGVLSSQFFQQCKHNISTFDCQPSGPGGGMLIFVSGTLQLLGEQHQLKFSQMFHLMPAQWGSFLVFNDIFRLNYDA